MFGERFRDSLRVNAPYEGLVAHAYDAFLPPGVVMPDDAVHAEVVAACGGTALELGVGNGRFLVPRLEDGLAMEGVDNAADMLERCRRRLRERGLWTQLHQGDMARLRLGRTYAVICCPAGSFTLVGERDRAHAALASYLDHLEPRGTLAISMHVPGEQDDTGWHWRLRRTGTDDAGLTFVVHEATGRDPAAQVLVAYNRLEVLDEHGQVRDTVVRKQRLRWWTRPQLEELYAAAGFVDVRSVGGDDAWVTVARRAG